MIDRDRQFHLRLAALTACGFAARLVFLLAFDNLYSHEAEAYSKLNLVAAWIESGMRYPDVNFGPLHTWIIYALTLPFDDKVLPVRLFSLACGTLVMIPFAYLVRLLFDDKVALTAVALLAVLPVHLRSSATSLAEAPYVLCLGTGLYYHLRYRLQKRTRFLWLVLAALCFNLAGMFRYEAWLWLPLLCFFLLRKNVAGAFAFGAMNLAFPLTHMAVCYSQTGNPFAFASTSAVSFLQYMPMMPLSYKLTGWIVSFASAMTATTAVLALLGLIHAAFVKRGFHLAMLFLFNFGVLQYKTLTNTIDPALTRYTAGMALLLLPFASLALWALIGKIGPLRTRNGISGFILTLLVVAQMLVFATLQARQAAVPGDVKQTMMYLRQHAAPEDVILADSRFHPYVLVESRLSYGQFVSLEFSDDRKRLKEDRLQELIEKTPPTIVVLDYFLEGVDEVNSNLDAFPLARQTEETTLRGLHFKRAAAFGDFVLFRTVPAAGEAGP